MLAYNLSAVIVVIVLNMHCVLGCACVHVFVYIHLLVLLLTVDCIVQQWQHMRVINFKFTVTVTI